MRLPSDKSLMNEQERVICAIKALLRTEMKRALVEKDLKAVFAIIKYAMIGKSWLWIYDSENTPWEALNKTDDSKTVFIWGEDELLD